MSWYTILSCYDSRIPKTVQNWYSILDFINYLKQDFNKFTEAPTSGKKHL